MFRCPFWGTLVLFLRIHLHFLHFLARFSLYLLLGSMEGLLVVSMFDAVLCLGVALAVLAIRVLLVLISWLVVKGSLIIVDLSVSERRVGGEEEDVEPLLEGIVLRPRHQIIISGVIF